MITNHKKELGLALQDMKSAEWFQELPKEDQEEAIRSTKAFFTPPDAMQNTLLNIALGPNSMNLLDKWVSKCTKLFPWCENPLMGNSEVKLAKVMFFTENVGLLNLKGKTNE